MNDDSNDILEKLKSSKLILIILLFTSSFGVMGGGLVAPGQLSIAAAFNVPSEQVSLILGLYTLAAAISLPFIGYYIDAVGRRKVGIICLLIDGIGGLAIILSPNFTILLIIRFFQGIGIAGLMPVAMTIAGDLYKGEERLRVVGYLSASIALAAMIIPLIGGILASINWKYVFLVYGLSLILAALFFFVVPETKPIKQIDNEKNKKETPIKYVAALFSTLKIKSIRNIIFHAFVLYFLLYSLISFLPIYLTQKHGFGEVFNGLALTIQALSAGIIASKIVIFSKYLKWHQRIVIGYVLIAFCFFLFPTWPQGSYVVSISFILFGIGMGFITPTIYDRVTQLSPPELTGAVISIFTTMKYLGMTASPLILGNILIITDLNNIFIGVGFVAAIWSCITFFPTLRKKKKE